MPQSPDDRIAGIGQFIDIDNLGLILLRRANLQRVYDFLSADKLC